MLSLISSGPTKGQEPNSSPDKNRVSSFAPCLNRKLVLPPVVPTEAGRERWCLLLTRISGPATHPASLLYQGLFFSSAHHDAAPGMIYHTWMTCTTSTPEEQIQVAKLPMAVKLTRGRTKDWWGMECGKGCRQHVLVVPRKTFQGAVYIC